jgi:protein-S-isoprenylcysteine O-methyltransferase Ste14
MVERYGPLFALLAFYGIGFGWRAWLQRRRYGATGIMLFRSGNWGEHLREMAMLLLGLLLFLQAVDVAGHTRVFAAFAIAGRPPMHGVLGLAVAAVAIALMVAAQLDMGASWRVGIDEGARPGLVTRGIYAWSRNPIYLAVFLMLAAFALLVPTWPSLLLAIGAPIGFRRQAMFEESYLRRTYGDAFERYASRVGRFVPGLGRLG